MKSILLMKIMMGLFAFLLVVVIAIPVYFNISIKIQNNACLENQINIETAALKFRDELPEDVASFPYTIEELVEKEYISEEYGCPSGGEYLWNPIDGTVTCNIIQHQK